VGERGNEDIETEANQAFHPPLYILAPEKRPAVYRNFAILGLGKGKSARQLEKNREKVNNRYFTDFTCFLENKPIYR